MKILHSKRSCMKTVNLEIYLKSRQTNGCSLTCSVQSQKSLSHIGSRSAIRTLEMREINFGSDLVVVLGSILEGVVCSCLLLDYTLIRFLHDSVVHQWTPFFLSCANCFVILWEYSYNLYKWGRLCIQRKSFFLRNNVLFQIMENNRNVEILFLIKPSSDLTKITMSLAKCNFYIIIPKIIRLFIDKSKFYSGGNKM